MIEQESESRGGPSPYVAGFLSALLPGIGQWYAGKRRTAVVMLTASGILTVVAGWFLTRGKVTLLTWLVQPVGLRWLLVANGLVLAFRAYAAADAYQAVGSAGRSRSHVLSASLVAASVFVVAWPHALAARYDIIQYDLITTVFAPIEPVALPAPPPTTQAPVSTVATGSGDIREPAATITTPPPRLWDGTERLNVLLLGGDGGPGRRGVRTDTIILASIDPINGHTAFFSVPRNMAQVPVPDDLDIWRCDCFPDIINELWKYGSDHPDRFPGTGPPGAEALKLAIGEMLQLEVHFYALINLVGFVRLIDAMGGVNITVPERVYDSNYPAEDGGREVIDIQPGDYHMNGHLALAYSRSRRGSDDYSRIDRQRCVIRAVVDQASVTTIVRAFPYIAAAIKDNLFTDIPLDRLPDFIELLPLLHADEIVSVRLVPNRFTGPRTAELYPTPDLEEIRRVVEGVLNLSPSEAKAQLDLDDLQEACG